MIMAWNLIYQGKKLKIADGVLTIGSSSQNDIVVPGISPVHASLFVEENGICVKSLTKSSECLINGKPEKDHILKEDDILTIGNTAFQVKREDENKSPETNQMLSVKFNGLMDALEALAGQRNIDIVTDSLLKSSVSLFDCEGGFLVDAKDLENQQVLAHWPKNIVPIYSKSAVRKAMQLKNAFQWFEGNDVDEPSKSMVAHDIHAVLCNALVNHDGHIEGVLYIHRRNKPGKTFSENDLHIFNRLCNIFGYIMEEVRLIQHQNLEIEKLKSSKETSMLYACNAMEELMQKVRKVATHNIPVLIQGETGTGKEVVSRTIHRLSKRKEKPFVAVNCGAIPESLLESELFGHVKGSFTGAIADHKGFFEQADGGTLMLDEIGELPMQMQVALLRVLQEMKIRKIGGTNEIDIDVRVICATNCILSKKVENASFRQDLFYRIGVFCLDVPPLRERERDVLLLAQHFMLSNGKQLGRIDLKLSKSSEKAILSWPWKGNVRELENCIQRGIVNARSRVIQPEEMGIAVPDRGKSLKNWKEEAEKEAISHALTSSNGNLTLAAKILDIDRKVLRDIMNRLSINKDIF